MTLLPHVSVEPTLGGADSLTDSPLQSAEPAMAAADSFSPQLQPQYADGQTFPSVLTPFHWLSCLPMVFVGLVFTLWILHQRARFYSLKDLVRCLWPLSGGGGGKASISSSSCSSSSSPPTPSLKKGTVDGAAAPLGVSAVQPVLMPHKCEMMATIKL